MSSNNFTNIPNENQSYPFNGVSQFYPQNGSTGASRSEQHPSSNFPSINKNHSLGIGLSGPGTHVEETPIPSASSGSKGSGRGRRKQRKKMQCSQNILGEALKMENADNSDLTTVNEGIPLSGLHEGDMFYQSALIVDDAALHGNQFVLNSNTLDQVLSQKKMILMQSPDVVDFIRNQLAADRK